jgi:hypothetical protein
MAQYKDKKSAQAEWAEQKYDAFFAKMEVTSAKDISLAQEIAPLVFNDESLGKLDTGTLCNNLAPRIGGSFMTKPAFELEMFWFAHKTFALLAETDISHAQKIADMVQWESRKIPDELKFDMYLEMAKLYFN